MKSADEQALTDAAGLRADEIVKPLNSISFVLEDSGETVVMRKPMIEDLLASEADTTVKGQTEQMLSIVSLTCTFDGKVQNWKDILKKYSILDYNIFADEYLTFTRPKKERATA